VEWRNLGSWWTEFQQSELSWEGFHVMAVNVSSETCTCTCCRQRAHRYVRCFVVTGTDRWVRNTSLTSAHCLRGSAIPLSSGSRTSSAVSRLELNYQHTHIHTTGSSRYYSLCPIQDIKPNNDRDDLQNLQLHSIAALVYGMLCRFRSPFPVPAGVPAVQWVTCWTAPSAGAPPHSALVL